MRRKIRIIIAGSREFDDYDLLKTVATEVINLFLRKFLTNDISNANLEIISGGAKGADQLGEKFAEEHGYKLTRFPADWKKFGKKAGYLRNIEMAEYAGSDDAFGVLIAFWNGTSKGTRNMIRIADRYGLKSYVIKYSSSDVPTVDYSLKVR